MKGQEEIKIENRMKVRYSKDNEDEQKRKLIVDNEKEIKINNPHTIIRVFGEYTSFLKEFNHLFHRDIQW